MTNDESRLKSGKKSECFSLRLFDHFDLFGQCNVAIVEYLPVRKPVRRVDVREPLEKLSLLSIKEPRKTGAETGRIRKTARRPRPDRWM